MIPAAIDLMTQSIMPSITRSVWTSGWSLAALELGSVWMLGWLAAAGIPLALHLLHRRRQQEISWAAMELLMQAIQQNSRTIRIEGWLLLLLRTLALVLLAVGLARPLLTSSQRGEAATSEPPRLLVIVLDATYSMQYQLERSSLWQRAQEAATALVQQANQRDAFMLIQFSDSPQAIIGQPVYDASRVVAEIGRLRPTDAGGRLASCLELISQTLEDAKQTLPDIHIEVIFFSDMGRDSWQAAIDGDAKSQLQQLSSRYGMRIESLAVDRPNNIALTSFEADSPLVLEGRALRCAATVHNYSDQAVTRLPVQFQSEGSTLQTEFVDCPPGQSRTVTTQLQPPGGRFWRIGAALPEDALAVDNRRDLIISVRPQVKVVSVEGRAGGGRLINLSLAPAGSAESFSLKRRGMTVQAWSLLELQSRSLKEIDAVLLVDVPRLDSGIVIKLREYVEGGGAVLTLLGPQTDGVAWNQTHADSLNQLFGFRLEAPAAQGDWRIDPLNYRSPIAKPFANYLDAGLLTTPIFRYWKVAPVIASDAPLSGSETSKLIVDLGLNSGEPWILRRSLGMGWVAAMLSAPESGSGLDGLEASWNAVATWPSFVPIMQKLVETLVGGGDAQHNVVVGQPLRGWMMHSTGTTEVLVARPDKSQSRLTIPVADGEARPNWLYMNTDRSGIYEVTKNPSFSSENLLKSTEFFAVNIEPNQSAMQSVDVENLPMGRPTGASGLVEQRTTSDAKLRASETLVKVSLWLLLGVLAAESLLAWHLGRRLV